MISTTNYIISQSLLFVIVVVLSIIFHEFGHLVILRKLKNKWVTLEYLKGDINVGTDKDYKGLTDREYRTVAFVGFLFGFVPIFVFLPTLFWLYGSGALFAYVVGSRHDLKSVLKTLQEGTDEDTEKF